MRRQLRAADVPFDQQDAEYALQQTEHDGTYDVGAAVARLRTRYERDALFAGRFAARLPTRGFSTNLHRVHPFAARPQVKSGSVVLQQIRAAGHCALDAAGAAFFGLEEYVHEYGPMRLRHMVSEFAALHADDPDFRMLLWTSGGDRYDSVTSFRWHVFYNPEITEASAPQECWADETVLWCLARVLSTNVWVVQIDHVARVVSCNLAAKRAADCQTRHNVVVLRSNGNHYDLLGIKTADGDRTRFDDSDVMKALDPMTQALREDGFRIIMADRLASGSVGWFYMLVVDTHQKNSIGVSSTCMQSGRPASPMRAGRHAGSRRRAFQWQGGCSSQRCGFCLCRRGWGWGQSCQWRGAWRGRQRSSSAWPRQRPRLRAAVCDSVCRRSR